jgi:hypothetical protein
MASRVTLRKPRTGPEFALDDMAGTRVVAAFLVLVFLVVGLLSCGLLFGWIRIAI